MNGAVMVTSLWSGRTKSARAAEVLDDAEQIVPAARVQTRRVVTQLVEDLLHLERGRDGLDEHSRPDGTAIEREMPLVEVPPPRPHDDHSVPDTRLEGVLPALRRGEGDLLPHGVGQVDLPGDHVRPVR